MKLFEVKNNIKLQRTEIVLFGIKIKIRNKNFFEPTDYTFALEKAKSKYKNNEKIKVGFLVSEQQKWNCEELYNMLAQSDVFEPIILVTLLESAHLGIDKTRNNLNENYEYFVKNNKNVEKAYDEEKKEYIDLKKFGIDILFYQQHWELSEIQNIDEVSKYALCCYFPYGLDIFENKLVNFLFHEKLFIYFLPNEYISKERKKYRLSNHQNEMVVGFPKFDVYKTYLKNENTDTAPKAKKTIIYAPHFSYSPKHILNIGTFDKTGVKILEFAQKHNEYNWVFRPHPNLKYTLYSDKNYGEKFTDTYFEKWKEFAQISENGNVLSLFLNSDLLITDASTFLLEYLFSRKPLIRLCHKSNKKNKFNCFGKELSKCLYSAYSFADFENYFNKIMVKNEDVLSEKRINFLNICFGDEVLSSRKIVTVLENLLK